MTTFTFSFPPQGLFSLLPLLPAFRRLRRPQTSPCRVKNSSKPSSRGLELRTPPSWEEKLVAQDGDGPGDLVHNDVDWMGPPGKKNWFPQPPPLAAANSSDTSLHIPTPRTGTKNRLVPCMNSSLLFILVSGSRCAILTPSSAFRLCALEKNRTTSILK